MQRLHEQLRVALAQRDAARQQLASLEASNRLLEERLSAALKHSERLLGVIERLQPVIEQLQADLKSGRGEPISGA